MTANHSTANNGLNGQGVPTSVADELKQESDKLLQLALFLKAREESLAEMAANYPHFRSFVYDKVREEFQKSLAELPGTDLEALARQWDAKPLEEFIAEFERVEEKPPT